MKKLQLFIPLLFLINSIYGQIDVNPAGAAASAFTPQELVENVLLTNCATINWINEKTFVSGANSNFGYFVDNGSAFPLGSGVVLSTGFVSLLEGINNSSISPNTVLTQPGDADLELLCNTNFPGVDVPTFDAVCFEFEITPGLNSLSFSYIFASEEYDDFDITLPDSSSECFNGANQGLQDTFAILVSGPGIVPDPEFAGNPPANQWNNIAKIPTTTTPVSVGTIHGNPTCIVNPNANNTLFNSIPLGTGDIRLNGMTDILTAATGVTPGQTYRIKIVIGDRGDFQSDSAVFLLGSTIGLNVDLGPDLSVANGTAVCGLTQLLDAGPGGTMYTWTGPGGFSANSQTVNVSAAGLYTVEVSAGGCVETDSILVEFVPTPGASRVDQALAVCDDNFGAIDDGIALFNLTIFDATILAHPSNIGLPVADLNVIYYETEADAIANTNPIPDPANYLNSTPFLQVIFFRVENVNSPSCLSPFVLADHSFNVAVLETFQIATVSDISVCDLDVDGTVMFDLTPQITEAIGALNPADIVIDFYDSEADLLANVNPYPTTMATVTSSPQEIWVRLSNALRLNCFTYTSFLVTTLDAPQIQALNNYELCDDTSAGTNTDGFAVFDLSTYDIPIVNGQATVFSPTYHTSQADADAGINPIVNPTAYTNGVANVETIFVRLEDSVNGCVNTASFDLIVVSVPTLNDITLIQCEVDAVIDGLTLFTLSEANSSLITAGVAADYIFSYHLSQADANAFVNPLANNYNNSIPNEVIFARVQENTTGCFNVAQVTLSAVNNPVPAVALELCDFDDNGIENFILSNANAQILPAVPAGSSIVYYVSEFDAQQEINPLPNAYTSTAANQIIFYRVEDSGACYGIGTLTLNSNPLPLDTVVSPFNLCSDDGATAIFDLSSKAIEILNGQTGMSVTYFPSLADAIAGTNAHPPVYANTTDPETIFVRIENILTGCFTTGTSFDLNVNQNPPVVVPTPLRLCDDVSLGDGVEQFDLTLKNTEISGGNTNLSVTYYTNQIDADAETNELTGLYTNVANPDVVFVRVEDITTGCYSTTTLALIVAPLPTAVTPLDLYACDVDNNGITAFNLTTKDLEITASDPDLSVSYHETATDASQNLNALVSPYTNINFPFLQPIFARVLDANTGCFVVVTFNLIALDSPQLDIAISPYEICDTDQDGLVVFDLTSKTNEILNGQSPAMSVSYYETNANAQAGINAIVTPAAYPNTSNPQTVFFRIDNPDDGDPNTPACFVVGEFDLVVNLPPVLQSPVPSIEVCDDDFYVPVTLTPRFTFDLTQQENFILGGLTGITLIYFDDDTNVLITDPTAWENITNADTIRVEATDGNGCVSQVFFDVRVLPNPTPLPPAQTQDLSVCDGDGNATSVFNLTVNEVLITGGDPDVTVAYYETFDAANTDPIVPGIPNPTTYANLSNPQTIYLRVTNAITGCYTITSFDISVPLPIFDLGEDVIICLNATGSSVDPLPVLDTGLPDDGTFTFDWVLNGTGIAGNSPSIVAQEPGTYSVTVTGGDPLCFTSDSIEVIPSSAPLNLDLVVTTDFFTTDDHTIVATVSGSGTYQYSIDNEPFQDSNIFTNVSVGEHTVTVIDTNGCGVDSDTIAVIGYKKFFTPNGDGYNDTWQIVGISALPNSEIFIFDRYGKLLKQLSPNSLGWDGTYKGVALPSTDYWFKLIYQKDGVNREFSSHFAMKR